MESGRVGSKTAAQPLFPAKLMSTVQVTWNTSNYQGSLIIVNLTNFCMVTSNLLMS